MQACLFETANMVLAGGVAAKITGENIGAAAFFVGTAALIHKTSRELFSNFQTESNGKTLPDFYNRMTLFILLGSALSAHKITELFIKKISIDSVLKIGQIVSMLIVINSKTLH